MKKSVKPIKAQTIRFFSLLLLVVMLWGSHHISQTTNIIAKDNTNQTVSLLLVGKEPDTHLLPLVFLVEFHPEEEKCKVFTIPPETPTSLSDNNSWRQVRLDNLYRKGASHEQIKINLENITGKKIDHYLKMNLHGLEKIIDELEDVIFYCNEPIRYTSVQLDKGKHELSGEIAVELLISSLPQNPTLGGRLIRDMLASAYEVTQGELLPSLIWIGINNTSTDMRMRDLWQLHRIARPIPPEEVHVTIWDAS